MDRSSIKKEFKQARRPMGVYAIINSRDDRTFVGFAADLSSRINRHKAELKFGSHRNRELQELWNSCGESAFKFEILEVLEYEEKVQAAHDEELRVLALMWIEKLERAGGSIVSLDN